MGPEGPAGEEALSRKRIYIMQPTMVSGVLIPFGVSWNYALGGAGSTVAVSPPYTSSGNDRSASQQLWMRTGTEDESLVTLSSSLAPIFLGSQPGRGGFDFRVRFGFLTVMADMRFHIGLSQFATISGDAGTAYANTLGICKDEADGTMFIATKEAHLSTALRTDTGVAPNVNDLFDFSMVAEPNSWQVTCRLVNAITGVVYVDDLVLSTNLPAADFLLTMRASIQARTASANGASLAISKIYCESET